MAKKAKKQGAMGRPPISALGVKSKINISIDPDLKKYLDKLTSRSAFINDAIRKAIELAKADKKVKRKNVAKKTGNKVKRKGTSRSQGAT